LLAALQTTGRGAANIVNCDKLTLESLLGSVKRKSKFSKSENYETTQEPCPMPEKFGSVFDSKMSVSLCLRNDSEADTHNAPVITGDEITVSRAGLLRRGSFRTPPETCQTAEAGQVSQK
jgi:hypothetical protein